MISKLTRWERFHRRFFVVGALCGIGAIASASFIPVLAGVLGCICFLGLVFGSIGGWDN